MNLKKYRVAVLKAAATGELTVEWRAAHPNVEPATKLLDRILTERRQKRKSKFAGAGNTPPKNSQEKYPDSEQQGTSSLPNLSSGWCWANIEQTIQIIDYRGRTPPYSDAGIPHLRSFNVKQGKIIWDGVVALGAA